MQKSYCKHSFNAFKDSLLLSAQLPNTKVSFRHSIHSKERFCCCHESPRSSKPCLFFSTDFPLNRVSCYSLKRVPFYRLCSYQSPFYRCSTTRTPLLYKGSLAPLNEATKPTKADYALSEVLLVALNEFLQESNLVFSERSPHSTELHPIL